MIGKTLNHFKVLDRIGKGGMGEVYVAEDSRLKRKVALKVLSQEMAGDPVRLERFQRCAPVHRALALCQRLSGTAIGKAGLEVSDTPGME